MLHTVKVHAVIDESRHLHLPLPADTPLGVAEVIVLVTPANLPVNEQPITSLRALFAEFDARPLVNRRSRAEIDAQIANERASWD